jgi:hypothetical protein
VRTLFDPEQHLAAYFKISLIKNLIEIGNG